jgi:hypothetical protein
MRKNVKKEIRVLGIDDSPFSRDDKDVLIVGCLFRGGEWIDGVMSCRVTVDGDDATAKLIEMINRSKFKKQIQCIFLDGIAFGGFNVVNIKSLHMHTGIPVIVIVRKMPNFLKLEKALKRLQMERKYQLMERAGVPVEVQCAQGRIFIQYAGMSYEDAAAILHVCCTHSYLPEAIRVAHLIGAGIITGESKGSA